MLAIFVLFFVFCFLEPNWSTYWKKYTMKCHRR